jgi:hypothetical protein
MIQQKSEDEETIAAIRQKVLGYLDAWYQGDPERGQKSLHPELIKRIVLKDPESGKDYLDGMSASKLMNRWASGDGKKTPKELQLGDITILDVHGDIASVKLETPTWVDYMHLAKMDGEWALVNILWERKP